MFEEGSLLLFRPFIFKNGVTPKDKIFLVLGKDIQGGLLLASLPTSKDHVPSDVEVKHGCLDMPRNLLSKQEISSWFLKQSNNIYHHIKKADSSILLYKNRLSCLLDLQY